VLLKVWARAIPSPVTTEVGTVPVDGDGWRVARVSSFARAVTSGAGQGAALRLSHQSRQQ
jgi:hypothetical protein